MSYRLRLKEIRQEKGLNQGELADMIPGITLRKISSWEIGESKLKLEDACKLCDALGCTPNDLCGWYIDHPREPEALPPDEAALMENYRACTPEQRAAAALAVENAAGASLKSAEGAPHEVEVSA